ncbi:MAG TPA: tRNA pseudouridine(38-40) synthase TruA [Actinomycetales bacterium]|nr:tRNA pseudouridine(38-40) synthase TruA [Actinomycetales bacterium]
MRVRLDLAYDGTDFAGWAAQPGLRTVEDLLAEALGRVLRMDPAPRLTVAGRTDAGVHARGQVCHADVPASSWDRLPSRPGTGAAEWLVRRLAGVLPADVVVRRARLAPEDFHARFSAVSRRYVYRVADDERLRDPLRRRHVLWLRRALDVPAMHEATQPLIGEHDFLPFCRPRPGATTVRTLTELRWERDTDGLAVATVVADAFCHHMVRALVGVSLAVGEGRRPPSWPGQVLAAGRRDSAVLVAPPQGLTLEGVEYPSDDEVAARAARTRARRDVT